MIRYGNLISINLTLNRTLIRRSDLKLRRRYKEDGAGGRVTPI